MFKTLFTRIKSLLKPLLALCLVATLVLGQADGALAARSGGRIGGGSFRAPSRTYTAPSRNYRSPSGGYGGGYGGGYYPGGGYGFPFLVPIFSIGGGFGGLFTLLIFISIASFLVRSVRRNQDELGYDSYGETANPAVAVARLQVGLLASARTLQSDLDRIAASANTGSSAGLAQVLQETTLALLRHPEYWVYAGSETQKTRLEAAELQFNRLALAERSKFTTELLSNVNNQMKQAPAIESLPAAGELAATELTGVGEYIVVTLLVATQGQLELPKINSSDDLRQALSQFGAVSSDRLLALEVLWTPQAEDDTLSSDDLVGAYPNLTLV